MLEKPLSTPDTPAIGDNLVAHLLGEALALLDRDRNKARRRIEHAFALSRPRNDSKLIENGGTLAGWQLRRAIGYIENNLGTSLRIEEVAIQVHLSASYFSRAFKASVGVCYTEFVAQARIALAKRLLLTTELPIAEIALLCGFSDQPHLTRVFGRAVGVPPYTWRRQLVGAAHEQGGAAIESTDRETLDEALCNRLIERMQNRRSLER
ncbi:AraC family transcriptional regulator [Bradyrhizobium sp. AZCC 2230]|uniref:AraC family transcriptional regulator n=1 Tax=Bradyrhizobium sp. AZCC 2230 TaxID=3117021 RepID=UPI002FF3DCE2